MSPTDDARARFESIKTRLEAICSELGIAPETATVVVDTGDLEIKCRRFQKALDRLVALRATPDIDEQLGQVLIDLQVASDDMAMCCSDLKGPLDRLISAMYERLPDPPESDDDDG